MSNVMNNSVEQQPISLLSALENVSVSTEAPTSEAESIKAEVKLAVDENANADLSFRQTVAKMTATFVKLGEHYLEDENVRKVIDADIRSYGLEPVFTGSKDTKGREQNIFLPFMKTIKGHWKLVRDNKDQPKKDKNGKNVEQWQHDRKYECYANVTQFFIFNGISWDQVEAILNGSEPITIEIEGQDKPYEVAPTIKAIIAANTLQRNGKNGGRATWNAEAKAAAKSLQPLVTIKLTPKQQLAFSWSDDNYTTAFLRIGKDGIEVLGDTGMDGSTVQSRVKRRLEKLKEAYKATINKAA